MNQWKPSDEQSWSLTKKSIEDDGPTGAKFLVFLNFWLNTAETMLAESGIRTEQHQIAGDSEVRDVITASTLLTPANALRQALEVAEQRLGFVDVWFLGQLLVVICMYWSHGDAAAQEFSIIELKFTGNALAYKIHELQEAAEQGDDTPESDEVAVGVDG